MANVTVLGAGAWGTAFGQVLADAGNHVTMWAIEPEIVADINKNHRNSYRLPSVERLPDTMTATGDRAEAVRDSDLIVITIAAQYARRALESFADIISENVLVMSLMKGIERGTGKRMDEVVAEALHIPSQRLLVLSGANLSKEVALRNPAGAVIGCSDIEVARKVAQWCCNDYFKPYISTDVIGLEMCGSLKNVVALAVGMARGAGYGANTAAMLECRGLAELTELGVAAGAQAKTFVGIAGMGDLTATCSSSLSRNSTFGYHLGRGMSVEEATKVSDGVAEGVPTTHAVLDLAATLGVHMPLATAVSHVLERGISFDEMMAELFDTDIAEE